MHHNYAVGDSFTLSEEALANYGSAYRGQVFTVTYWADHYVPSAEFFDPASPRYREAHGSPGFDENAGSRLYDSDFPGALYKWEMKPLKKEQNI